ncbi:MAG: universal stress protein [Polyangiaceae bacterium]|nr:universal stress protein [Polyangiaceae bacterium]
MTHPKHVLAVTDFSDAADAALRQASGVARMFSAKLSVLHVVPDFVRANPLFPQGSERDIQGEVELEKKALDELAVRVKEVTGRPQSDVELAIRIGAVEVAVVRFAEEADVDLIVVGATGRTGLARLFLGSTAERVVRYSHCSVLVARSSAPTSRVLGATDLSKGAHIAVERAKAEAELRGAKLDLIHVMDFSSLGWSAAGGPLGGFSVSIPQEKMDEMRKLASETLSALGGPGSTPHVVDGSPKRAIVSTAESIGADLIVVGTHGRTGLARMALGSVAEGVVQGASCSVLVVRPDAAHAHKAAAGNFDE